MVCLTGAGFIGPLQYWEANESDEQEIMDLLNSYFSLRYEAFQKNSTLDFSTISDGQDAKTAEWLKLEADKREIEIRIHTEYAIRIQDYRFHLNFKRIEIEQNNATVKLLESNEITYGSNPDYPSSMADLEHEISLVKIMDVWFITNDVYNDDMRRLLMDSSTDGILKNINHDRIEADMPIFRQDASSMPNSFMATNWHLYNYDNSKAVTYADANYNQAGPVPLAIRNLMGWNPLWPTSYKFYNSPTENDCTNFISQAVFEGISYTASDSNYFYPDSTHYSDWWYYKFSTTTDGSHPWINVGGFYDFLNTNYYNYITWGIGERGPVGYGIDLCNIQPGDIIFMWAQSAWQHSVIVDQIGSNPCNANNVFVAAHSDNYKTRPLSEYSAYLWYPVEIKGYLDEVNVAYLPIVTNSTGAAGLMMQTPYPTPGDTYEQVGPSPTSAYPVP